VTVAACYLSPEGVVLGADSTTTYWSSPEPHYYNNAQKLFEIGDGGSTIGVVTWGLGGLAFNGHRRQFALLSDSLAKKKAPSVMQIANRWIDLFWPEYLASPMLVEFRNIAAKGPYDPAANPPDPLLRTEEEERKFVWGTNNLGVGFCIAGYVLSDRTPAACEILFSPMAGVKPTPTPVGPGFRFWGAPNMIRRLVYGHDEGLRWTCTSLTATPAALWSKVNAAEIRSCQCSRAMQSRSPPSHAESSPSSE
jgi:hypothetical protein